MSQHQVNDLLESSMKNLKGLVDANTIMGTPITTPDGTVIIPVSKVSFGFGTGGSDFPSSKPGDMFGGGSGGGVSVQPLAFLVVQNGYVQLLQMSSADNTADRLVNIVPELIDKVSEMIQKSKKDKDPSNIGGLVGE